MVKLKEQLKVYYDGTCNICISTMRKISKKDINKEIIFLNIHEVNLDELPDKKKILMEKMHCKKGNEIYIGVSAFIEIFRVTKGYKLTLFFIRIAKKIGIGNSVYNIISKNRYLLPFNKCTNGKCSIQ